MTYNQFIKEFDEYKKIAIQIALEKYRNQKEAAKKLGISEATLSRAINGVGEVNKDVINKILGYDIYDTEIENAKTLEIKYLENRLAKLKET